MHPRWKLTPEIEKALSRIYSDPIEHRSGALNRLSARLAIPSWRLGRWARDLGLYQIVRKQPDWSPRELALLEANAHLGLDRIALKLRKAGFTRTATAIQLKMKRDRIEPDREVYTARQVAIGLGVDAKTMTRWIALGRIRAFKKGTRRTELQGGDHWLVSAGALRRFVAENLGEIHLGKVDKAWFVSLLTGGRVGGPHFADGTEEDVRPAV